MGEGDQRLRLGTSTFFLYRRAVGVTGLRSSLRVLFVSGCCKQTIFIANLPGLLKQPQPKSLAVKTGDRFEDTWKTLRVHSRRTGGPGAL